MPSITRVAALMALLVASPWVLPPSLALGQVYAPDAANYVPSNAPRTLPVGYETGANPLPPRIPAAQTAYAPTAYTQPASLPDQYVGELPPIPISQPKPLPALPRLSPAGETSSNRKGKLPSVVTVAGSLAVVLGIFFLVAWGMRRAAPAGSSLLPGEVLEVLGRAPLAQRQQVSLVRCGKKLLLVSTTPTGAETLTEITEPEEVDRLAGLCLQGRPDSATVAFRNVLQQFTGNKAGDVDA